MPQLGGMSILSATAIGAGLTALMAGWSQVKGFGDRVLGLVMVTATIDCRAAQAAQYYCTTKLRRAWTPFRYFSGYIMFVKSLSRHRTVVYENMGEKTALYWKGWRPLWVSLDPQRGVIVRFARGTMDPEQLVLDIVDHWSRNEVERRGSRFGVHRISGRSGKDAFGMMSPVGAAAKSDEGDQATPSVSASSNSDVFRCFMGRVIGFDESDIGEACPEQDPVNRISTTPEVDDAIAEVQRWFGSRDWYIQRQIPWRRGLLLTGQPGTGKSSLSKAIAQELDIPIYLLDIATMDNQEFHSAWKQALENTPAMVLIEDIDNVFHLRENVVTEKGKGLSFDCMLNTISGVESSDGVLLIITSNHPERLDPALGLSVDGSTVSTRPGRIDRVVNMGVLEDAGRRKMAERIMAGCHPSWVDRLVAEGANDTGAQFEDRCAQVALRLFWEGSAEEGTTPDSLPTRWVMADDPRCQAGSRRAPQLKAQL